MDYSSSWVISRGNLKDNLFLYIRRNYCYRIIDVLRCFRMVVGGFTFLSILLRDKIFNYIAGFSRIFV